MPTVSLGAPWGAAVSYVSVSVKGDLLTLSKPKSEALGALGTMAKALNFLKSGQAPPVGLINLNNKTLKH